MTTLNFSSINQSSSKIPDQYLCPITKTLMNDPVIAADGVCYDKQSITRWLQKSKISPISKIKLENGNLTPNNIIKQLILKLKENNPSIKFVKLKNIEIDKIIEKEVNLINSNSQKNCYNGSTQQSLIKKIQQKDQLIKSLQKKVKQKQTKLQKVTKQNQNFTQQAKFYKHKFSEICKVLHVNPPIFKDFQIYKKQSEINLPVIENDMHFIDKEQKKKKQFLNKSKQNNIPQLKINLKNQQPKKLQTNQQKMINQINLIILDPKQNATQQQQQQLYKQLQNYFHQKKQVLQILVKQYQEARDKLKQRINLVRNKQNWKKISTNLADYEGEIVNGKKNGIGIQKYSQNQKYEGEWKDDCFHGFGKIQLQDGGYYEGFFSLNKMDKFGFYQFGKSQQNKKQNEGDSYLGQYKKGAQQGYGIFIYKNENKSYEGEWLNNQYSGLGKIMYCNKNMFMGQFKRGKKNGQGIYVKHKKGHENQYWIEDKLIKQNDARYNGYKKTKKISKIRKRN